MKEALKLALEALETCCAGDYSTGHVIDPSFDEDAVNDAITAIKEALAQPDYRAVKTYHEGKPVYVSQPEQRPWGKPWVSLTDEQIWKFWWSRPEVLDGEDDSMEAEFVAAVRRVLAAHGIKENT